MHKGNMPQNFKSDMRKILGMTRPFSWYWKKAADFFKVKSRNMNSFQDHKFDRRGRGEIWEKTKWILPNAFLL